MGFLIHIDTEVFFVCEFFEGTVNKLLDYTQPDNIIKVCTEFNEDFFSNYCNKKDINFKVIDFNFKEIYHANKNLISKKVGINEFSFIKCNDIIVIENNPLDSKSWENIERIIELLSFNNFPILLFVNFLNLKFTDDFEIVYDDLVKTYDFLEKLLVFYEKQDIKLSLQICSSDVCFLYPNNVELEYIFENYTKSNNFKEYYFGQSLLKELEIFKFKKEIANLNALNSQWINRNSILTKTKEELLAQNELLNQKNEELIELNSQWINRNTILSKTKKSLLDENQKLSSNIEDIETKFNEVNKNLSKIEKKSNIAKKEYFKKKSEEFNLNLIEKDKLIKGYENKVKIQDSEIGYKDSLIQILESKLSLKDSEVKNFESKLLNKEDEISEMQNKVKKIESLVDLFKNLSNFQLNKLNSQDYVIKCYEEEIENNDLEIAYFQENSFVKKILNPFSYILLCLKSNPKDLKINLKLYRAIKNTKCFDIGFYLNNNKDIYESKWCKYFSPELHYICAGFDEKRKFNKKYYDRNSKKDLLNYILNCH